MLGLRLGYDATMNIRNVGIDRARKKRIDVERECVVVACARDFCVVLLCSASDPTMHSCYVCVCL